MTLVPDKQTGSFGLSGKDIAILQREVADLEAKKEFLNRECNWLDSFRQKIGSEIYSLDKDKVAQLSSEAKEYLDLIQYRDVLRKDTTNQQQRLDDLTQKVISLEPEKKQLEIDVKSLQNKLQKQIDKLHLNLNYLSNEVEVEQQLLNKIKRDKVEIEKVLARDQKAAKLLLEETQAKNQLLNEREIMLVNKGRDLAVKHRRLKEVAAQYGVKGV